MTIDNTIKILKRPGFEYLYLFLATLAILIIKFPDMWFGPGVLAGWDTVGHYQAFLKQAELIQAGQLKGYLLGWFGGMPFLYFYSPLFFWLGGLMITCLPFISPILIFKGLILLFLAAFSPAFYYFSKTFLPVKASAWLAGSLALLYIFYQPVAFGDLGIGLAGAVASGLVTHGPGLILSLLFLAYFKRLLVSSEQYWHEKYFYLAIISGSALLYTHLISTVFAAILGLIIMIHYWPNRQSFLKSILVLVGISLLSAYYLLPFLSYYQYSSDWSYPRIEGFFFDPLQPLLAVDPLDFINGRWGSINWPWLTVGLSFVIGFSMLVRRRLFVLPALFLIPFLVVPRDYLSQVLGTSMHYYRIMPLLIVLFLVIALYALTVFDNYLQSKVKYMPWRLSFWLLVFILVAWKIAAFSFSLNSYNVKPNLAMATNNPLEYKTDLNLYPGQKAVGKMLSCLESQGAAEGRVSVEPHLYYLTQQIGSAHYFDYALLEEGFPLLQGLYSESGNQTAFIYPPFASLSPRAAGYEFPLSHHLYQNSFYRSQSAQSSVKQLGLFNAQYILAFSPEAIANLERLPAESVKAVNCENTYFGLFEINQAVRRPYLSQPEYKPMLFVQGDNSELPFRLFSLGWYSLEKMRSVPVIYRDGVGVDNMNQINSVEWPDISAVVVSSNALTSAQVEALQKIQKAVVVLASETYHGEVLPDNFTVIQNFHPVADYDSYNRAFQPDLQALEKFLQFVEDKVFTMDNQLTSNDQPQLLVWQDERISFTGRGPVIINASYFPAWRSATGSQIFEVTPGQMLVFSEGETSLEFKSSISDVIGGAVSGLFLLLLMIFAFGHKRLFPKYEK